MHQQWYVDIPCLCPILVSVPLQSLYYYMSNFYVLIIESVDSIHRDGADTRISLNKCNSLELPNMDVLSLFRQTTCSATASIRYNTLKVYSYSDSRKIVKMPLFQFKRPTAKLVLVVTLILS